MGFIVDAKTRVTFFTVQQFPEHSDSNVPGGERFYLGSRKPSSEFYALYAHCLWPVEQSMVVPDDQVSPFI